MRVENIIIAVTIPFVATMISASLNSHKKWIGVGEIILLSILLISFISFGLALYIEYIPEGTCKMYGTTCLTAKYVEEANTNAGAGGGYWDGRSVLLWLASLVLYASSVFGLCFLIFDKIVQSSINEKHV